VAIINLNSAVAQVQNLLKTAHHAKTLRHDRERTYLQELRLSLRNFSMWFIKNASEKIVILSNVICAREFSL
jgi:hypothetical protein